MQQGRSIAVKREDFLEFQSVKEMNAHYKSLRKKPHNRMAPDPSRQPPYVAPAPEIVPDNVPVVVSLFTAQKFAEYEEEMRQRQRRINNHLLMNRNRCAVAVDLVARHFKVKPADIIGQSRKSDVAYPRQIVMYLSKHRLERSFPQIGRFLDKRDHTTCLHGCKKIEVLLAAGDERTTDDVAAIVRAFDRLYAVLDQKLVAWPPMHNSVDEIVGMGATP